MSTDCPGGDTFKTSLKNIHDRTFNHIKHIQFFMKSTRVRTVVPSGFLGPERRRRNRFAKPETGAFDGICHGSGGTSATQKICSFGDQKLKMFENFKYHRTDYMSNSPDVSVHCKTCPSPAKIVIKRYARGFHTRLTVENQPNQKGRYRFLSRYTGFCQTGQDSKFLLGYKLPKICCILVSSYSKKQQQIFGIVAARNSSGFSAKLPNTTTAPAKRRTNTI